MASGYGSEGARRGYSFPALVEVVIGTSTNGLPDEGIHRFSFGFFPALWRESLDGVGNDGSLTSGLERRRGGLL